MSKSRHLSVLLAVALTGMSCEDSVQDQGLGITHGPYLQQLTDSSVMIIWHTGIEATSWVEYAARSATSDFPANDEGIQIARESQHGLFDAHTKLHRVTVSGLHPGHDYSYRVHSKLIRAAEGYDVDYDETVTSAAYSFTTLNREARSFSFVVLSDIHEDEARLADFLEDVAWQNVDIVFYNGDMLDYYDADSQIMHGFLDMSVRVFAKEIPFVLVRGNHETLGKSARHLMEHFPTASGRFYYAFDHGPVHFIILDSGLDADDSHPRLAGLMDFDRYREEQAEWLRQHVTTEAFVNAEFRIVLYHMPTFSTRATHGGMHARELWNPILNGAGVDLVLNGHLHGFMHHEPVDLENPYHIVVSAREAFTRVDVTTASLSVTVTDRDGDVLDEFSIRARQR